MSNKIYKNIDISFNDSKELYNTSNNKEYTLGEKIRNLRKQLNMTQSNLAGEEMTKSMLSQIENNLANPSIKTLQYLANRLDKPISYFIDDISKTNIEFPIHEVEKTIKDINIFFEQGFFLEASVLLDDILKRYSFEKSSILFADLQYKLGLCFIKLNKYSDAKERIHTATDIYIHNCQYVSASKAHRELVLFPWLEHNYDKCIEILDNVNELYLKSLLRDIEFEIENLYYKAIFYLSKGDHKLSLDIIKKALNITSKNNIYYRTDELYKMCAIIFLENEKYDDFKQYIKKAHQFAQFTKNQDVLINYYILYAEYQNNIGNHKKAIDLLNMIKDNTNQFGYIYHSECARTYYYLKDYYKCLEQARLIDYSKNLSCKKDYLKLWSVKVYEGLALSKLDKISEGIEQIKFGINKMSIFGSSKLLIFAFKMLSELYYEINDYENAFITLKQADNI